jgi:hypothetical protein
MELVAAAIAPVAATTGSTVAEPLLDPPLPLRLPGLLFDDAPSRRKITGA